MNFASVFSGLRGGISHGGAGNVTAIPAANPTQQLTTGDGTAAAAKPAEATPDPLNSHLDAMSKVWQTPTDAEGKPIAAQLDPLSQKLFNFKPEDVTKAAGQLDFTASINPELFSKVAAGGDDAVAAMKEIINGAVRSSFIAGTLNTGNLLNDGFGRHSKNIDAALPDRIKNYEVASRTTDDPVLGHAAVQPFLHSMKAMIRATKPNLSAAEVQAEAETYVQGLGMAVNMKQQAATGKKAEAEETNWMKYGGMES